MKTLRALFLLLFVTAVAACAADSPTGVTPESPGYDEVPPNTIGSNG
ncbi:MAG: hypothetical protein ACREKN_06485 [Longimicrobiaceae bacterium]